VNPLRGGWVILLSIAIAMMLAVAHLPEDLPQWLGHLRPAWVLLVVFYWVMALPDRLGMITAWLVGLLLDVLQGDPLGVNGFCLAALTYVTWSLYERLRMYTIPQQGVVVFLLVLGTELLRSLVGLSVRDEQLDWWLVLPAVMSMVLWPFVSLLLQRLQRQFAVD
jgi:rod shape-determining protein MreD